MYSPVTRSGSRERYDFAGIERAMRALERAHGDESCLAKFRFQILQLPHALRPTPRPRPLTAVTKLAFGTGVLLGRLQLVSVKDFGSNSGSFTTANG
jgi:hypothetical protein